MKNYAIPMLLLFTSCGTYHYISPTVNTNMYSEQGEVVGGIQLGSAGISANGGVAISQNFNINGFVAWMPEEDNGYNSRELELSAGYQTNPGRGNNVGSFYAGVSFGSNEYDKKELSGKFTR